MEDIEDLFKNVNQDEQRIPDAKRKIVRKFGTKKTEGESKEQEDGVVIDSKKFKGGEEMPTDENVPGA